MDNQINHFGTELSQRQLGMFVDIGCCAAFMSLAYVLDELSMDDFFINMKERLVAQGYMESEVDEMLKKLSFAMALMAKGLKGK